MSPQSLLDFLKTTFQEWNADDAPMLAAALAYYTAFSIAPLIVLVVAIMGVVVGQEALQSQILQSIEATIGESAAELINNLIENAMRPRQGIISTIIGITTLLVGALGVFTHLQNALDRIWDVAEVERNEGIMGFVKNKLLSFSMILVVGFLLLVSLILSAALSTIDNYAATMLPNSELLLRILSIGLSFSIITILFMMIYKFLPHVEIAWRDVIIGAAITSLLFTIGRTLLGLYLGNTAIASTYGAAGALVVLLIWVYYSAQIILFGAEFTQVYAQRYGSRIVADVSTDSE